MSFFLKRIRRSFLVLLFVSLVSSFFLARSVEAAVCTINAETVPPAIDQAYVDGNSCSSIEIADNVSTTWIGTVDLGGGTVTVLTGNTMTMGSSSIMMLGTNDDVIVQSGGVITHTMGSPDGLQITARNLTVSGELNVNGKGCSSSGGGNGYGPNLTTGVCTLSTSGFGKAAYGGGAHGGTGGAGDPVESRQTTTYGSSTAPTLLGASGGDAAPFPTVPGSGGGAIRLTISGTLTVDGAVRANGTDGDVGLGDGSGGGAGGSLYVKANVLTGSGLMSANGGNGAAAHGGGGGGGRIAVYYNALTGFTLSSVTAIAGTRGGSPAEDGTNGTTFILDRTVDDGAGNLRIVSGLNFDAGVDYGRSSITVDQGALLTCETQATLAIQATTLTDHGSTWNCANPVSTLTVTAGSLVTTGVTWDLSSVGSFVLTATSWNSGVVPSNITLSQAGSEATWDIGSDLTLTQFHYTGASPGTSSGTGGWLSIKNPISLSLVSSTLTTSVSSTKLTDFSMDADSAIDATGKGCAGPTAGDGTGPDTTTNVCTFQTSGYGKGRFGGGAHGGAGGTGGAASLSEQTATYDSATFPVLFGSSGADWNLAPTAPGSGGGVVRIGSSGTFVVNGPILADGGGGALSPGGNGSGGGAGGSINLSGDVVTLTSNLYARGGAGAASYGGGGGGGRIAILYNSLTFSGTSSTAGGISHGSGDTGGEGTVRNLLWNQSPSLPTALAPTALVNGSTTGTNNPSFTFSLADPDLGDTVKYRIQIDDSSDFASPVVDFTAALASQGTQSFQVGQLTSGGLYSVGSVDQTLPDGAYYWRVRAIDPSSAVSDYAVANGGSIAFHVDTVSRNIQFEQATASDGESVTATSVRLILNTAHFEDVTVHYALALSSTATGGGVDYTLASGDATIAAGGTSTTIPLTIIDDAIAETNETIVLTLSSPTNAVLGSNSLLTYTILDDDTSGVTVSKTTAAATEGGATDTYTVVLTSEPTSTVSIILATNAQLTLSTSTLSFTNANWSTPQTVTITATDDAAYEGAHSATITHTASSTDIGYNASTTIASILVSITDNDLPPSTGGGGGGAVGAGGSGTIPLFIPSFPTAIPLPPIVPAPSTTLLPSAQESLPAPAAPDVSSTAPTPTSTVRTPSARILNLVRQDFRTFNVSVTPEALRTEALFIQFGSDPITVSLGEGERRAIFRDLLDLQRRIPAIADHERLASGQIPLVRNLAQERRLLVRVRPTFRTIFGHDPRFADPTEARVWNTILYRLRIPRDLVQERAALLRFRTLFKRSPSDAFQWAVVRGLQGMGH